MNLEFVIYIFVRRIVVWRVSSSMRTDFMLDALEHALYGRQSDCEMFRPIALREGPERLNLLRRSVSQR